MVIESEKEQCNSSKAELHVNTADFTDEDFRTYLSLCDKIQYNEEMRRQHRLPKPTMSATLTRKEIFECSTLDEDGFLRALEHQNSYEPPPLRRDNFSRSMTEVMQYFDEDVVVDYESVKSESPVELQPTVGTVLANLQKNRSENSTPSPPVGRRNWQPKIEISSKIQELKRQYELGEVGTPRSPKKSRSPKALRKSMVKQLARIFNSKAAETVSEENAQKTRPIRATYRPQILPSPVQSPRSRRKQNTKTTNSIQKENKFYNGRRFARGEVVNEKQEPVKLLAKKLEANTVVQQLNHSKSQNNKITSINESKKLVTMTAKHNDKKFTDTGSKAENSMNLTQNEESPQSDNMFNVTNSIEDSTSTKAGAALNQKTLEEYPKMHEVMQQPTQSPNLLKVNSDKPQRDNSCRALISNKFSFQAPTPKRKKKKRLRRMLLWQPDLCMVEAKPVPSTDSESDYNTAVNDSPVKIRSYTKLFNKNIEVGNEHNYQPIFHALDESIRRNMWSPLKVGASHSLSIVFSERMLSGVFGSTIFNATQRDISRSCPSLIEFSVQVELLGVKATVKSTLLENAVPAIEPSMQLDTDKNHQRCVPIAEKSIQASIQLEKLIQNNNSRKLIESYIDDCFETATKDYDDIQEITKNEEDDKPNITEETLSRLVAADITESSTNQEKYRSGFSTPLKGHLEAGSEDDLLEKLDLSPILSTPSKSANGTPLICSPENILDPTGKVQKNKVASVQEQQKNNTRIENSVNPELLEKPSSVFWINTGDFCVSLDIYHNSEERLSLLYDIFIQKSYESKAINFGIDDQLYYTQDSGYWSNIRDHFPHVTNCSHYWFASGDMTLPFMGKFMLPEKIQRLFNLVREAVSESGTLHFGIDRFDFSNVSEAFNCKTFIHASIPKTTPNVMSASTYSNSIRTSDLDHSSFDSEASGEFALSTTPLSDNYSGSLSIDSAHFTLPQQDLMKSDYHSPESEEDLHVDNILKQSADQKSNEASTKWLSKPLNVVQSQQDKLKSVEQRIHRYANSIDLSPLNKDIEPFRDSPHYVSELQEIIAAIIDIGQVTGFKNCSLHQLESFTYFLSHYADICLDSCLEHMERILEALKEKRGIAA